MFTATSFHRDETQLAQGVQGAIALMPQLATKLYDKAKRHLSFQGALPTRSTCPLEVTELLGEEWDPLKEGKSLCVV